MKARKYAVVERRRCVACGECVQVCRKQAISVHRGCYAMADPELCVGCGLCSKSCPVGCIAILEREGEQNAEKVV